MNGRGDREPWERKYTGSHANIAEPALNDNRRADAELFAMALRGGLMPLVAALNNIAEAIREHAKKGNKE